MTGMCYQVLDIALTWAEAREECSYRGGWRRGGDLASINSLQEQTFMRSKILTFLSVPPSPSPLQPGSCRWARWTPTGLVSPTSQLRAAGFGGSRRRNSLECLDYVIYTPAFGSVALTLDCRESWPLFGLLSLSGCNWGKHCDTDYNLTPCIQSTIFIFNIRFLHNHRYFTNKVK